MSLPELRLDPIPEVGGQIGDSHAVFDGSLASAGAGRQQTVGFRHAHLAVAALVAPTKSSQDRDFVSNYILDAREEHFAFRDGEGRVFDLDVNEIGSAQEMRVLRGVWPASAKASAGRGRQTWNDSPQPQLPVEFGLLKRKPDPMMSST